MRVQVLTIFPELFAPFLRTSLVGRAIEKGILEVGVHDLREWTEDRHRSVDDEPYGGGGGMVMTAPPWLRAVRGLSGEASGENPEVRPWRVLMSPQGARLDDAKVRELACRGDLILLCGRYEGIDERLLARRVEEEVSLGDFVLSGGELAAMALMDAVVRQLPGALGDESSALEESFADGLLDCPQYTRPEVWPAGAPQGVPQVLLSGHHENIRRWRLKQALGRTWLRRPDLLGVRTLSAEEKKLLDEFQREHRS